MKTIMKTGIKIISTHPPPYQNTEPYNDCRDLLLRLNNVRVIHSSLLVLEFRAFQLGALEASIHSHTTLCYIS